MNSADKLQEMMLPVFCGFPVCLYCHLKQFTIIFTIYTPERQTLLSLVEHYMPNFSRLTKKNKLDLLLRGVNLDNDEFLPTNTILTKAVQNFILQTKRFVKIEIEE